MSIFLYQDDLQNLGKEKAFFRNENNINKIDFFLTTTVLTSLTYCHKLELVLAVLKITFSK